MTIKYDPRKFYVYAYLNPFNEGHTQLDQQRSIIDHSM